MMTGWSSSGRAPSAPFFRAAEGRHGVAQFVEYLAD
jgi:hypothetical protein